MPRTGRGGGAAPANRRSAALLGQTIRINLASEPQVDAQKLRYA